MFSIIASIIIAFITSVAGPAIILYIRTKLKSKSDIVTDTLHVSELINSKIEDIKHEFNADRVWITQFHNGGNFYPTGKSMAKFSVLYETVGVGVTSIQSNFSNIPVTLFSKSINHLLTNDIVEIADYSDPNTETYGLEYTADTTGCKSGYLFAIKTIDDKFIGTLGLDYTKAAVKLSEHDINHLHVFATSIGGVLIKHLEK